LGACNQAARITSIEEFAAESFTHGSLRFHFAARSDIRFWAFTKWRDEPKDKTMSKRTICIAVVGTIALAALLPAPASARYNGYVEGGYGLGWYGGRPYYYRPFGVYGGNSYQYRPPYRYLKRPYRYRDYGHQ
jgi:hypothetical protein